MSTSRAAILVDGGKAEIGFPSCFDRAARVGSVSHLICTHNDADHANGLLGFLRSGLVANEVWLPGAWTDRLDDLLLRPTEFAAELVSNIEQLQEDLPSESPLEELAERYLDRYQPDTPAGEDATIESLGRSLERGGNLDTFGEAFWSQAPLWPPRTWPYFRYKWWQALRMEPARLTLFIEAISAADRIRNISLEAFHHGSRIRWFQYGDKAMSGGAPGILEPINSKELTAIRRRHSALFYLSLTVSNRQSLVFLSPATSGSPPVLFTADSNLSFSQKIPWAESMIVTAPHHGSEANAAAYARFKSETKGKITVNWVRSDGNFGTRPGKSYLSVPGIRFCTICRGTGLPKQDVRLAADSSAWVPQGTRPCACH